ncbi:DUF262 domain-containing protein [Nostoc parmelioides]|uniref:DUF262 domain-containing protein n=1 Tax=Nostoc parmelioides FACHB-3921 TaxID=2692909 RepID=A0ABR8BL09_9NOSO|nr:DUF262 domain-containing protein [Nostoc parmelioides]MBD2254249.1 DUF262 domain-containing protein [Nostoc parmelioides FACHB-3921]
MTHINDLNPEYFKKEMEAKEPDILEEDNEIEELFIDEGNIVSEEEVNEPFEATEIRVETRQKTINYLLSKIINNKLELYPEFQRKSVWNEVAKSRLIESILLRIPLPAFYIDATNENNWLVIDGVQRLTSLKEFVIDKKLRLTGLESFTEFNGKIYDEIPRNYQRRIEETPLTVIFIEPGTANNFKQVIFERINTGGSSLSIQEIRHALNQGKATKLLENLAVSSEFKIATDNGIKPDRMADRECILRVLVFMINDQEIFKKSKSFKRILDKSMSYINSMSVEEINLIEKQFLNLMKLAYDIFGKDAFRKMKVGTKRYPINKALFESWCVNLFKLSDQEIKIIKEKKENIKHRMIDLTNEGKFDTPIYRSTGNIKTVLHRLDEIAAIIKAELS